MIKRKCKKTLSAIVAVVMMLSMISATAVTVSAAETGNEPDEQGEVIVSVGDGTVSEKEGDESDYEEQQENSEDSNLQKSQMGLKPDSDTNSMISTMSVNDAAAEDDDVTDITTLQPDADGFYLISDAEDLQWVADQVNNGINTSVNVRLADNIDASNVTLPIGTSSNKYQGTFDGNGKAVTINISANGRRIGFIGYGDGVTVKDLIIKGSISGTLGDTGGIVGRDQNTASSISGCVNEATITSRSSGVGGIAGVFYGTVTDCKNSGDVSGTDQIGGIVGDGSAVSGCSNTGNIKASVSNAGGIVGTAGSMGRSRSITWCSNTGTVTAGNNVGGIAGQLQFGDTAVVENCYNTGDVRATSGANGVGGLVGSFSSASIDISDSYNTGALSDNSNGEATGILIGKVLSGANAINITNSYYVQNGSDNFGTVGSQGTATVNGECTAITAEELAEITDENGFLITSQQEEPDVVSVKINNGDSTIDLGVGQLLTLTANIESKQGKSYHVHWKKGAQPNHAQFYIDGALSSIGEYNGSNEVIMTGINANHYVGLTASVCDGATHTDDCNGISRASASITLHTVETTISLDETALNMNAGEEKQLTATVSPEGTAVTWSSDNEDVATVEQNGKVTAMAVGTANITAAANGKTATCAVTVEEKEVTDIELDNTALNLKAGASGKLTAKVTPDDATDKTVTWSSNNEDVATVDQNGNIAAVAAGTAKITATAGEQTATCDVSVYEVDLQPLPEPGEVAEGETVAAGMSEEDADAARNTLNSIVEQIIDDSIPEGVSGAVEEIKSAVESGAIVTFEIRAEVLTEIPQDAAVKIDETVEKLSQNEGVDYEIQGYMDLGIEIYTQTALTEKLKVGELTSVDAPISFTIAVPDDIKEIVTKYYIIRIHENDNGQMETSYIVPTVNEDGTLTFSTDRFSVYALAYTTEAVTQDDGGNNEWTDIDNPAADNGNNNDEGKGSGVETVENTRTSTGAGSGASNASSGTAKTGDEMNIVMYAMIMMIAAVGISGSLIYRRRNSR